MDFTASVFQESGRTLLTAAGITGTLLVKTMKLFFLFVFAACLSAGATGHAQGITLQVKDVPLEQAFRQIEKQSGYSFWYEYSLLESSQRVSLNLKNVPLKQALDQCFKGQPLDYEIVNKTIVVRKKISPTKENDLTAELPFIIDVRGRVVNEKGEPVVGASVQAKGKPDKITTTDDNGNFALRGLDENAVLIISAVNIERYEVKVKGESAIGNIQVMTKITTGDAVVVNTGYQQLKPNEVTGSVVVITKEDLDKRVAVNIIDKLEGITNGLVFNKDAGTGQNKLRIRGESTINGYQSPLIVVDGFPYEGDINNINPNDVESITILKDAAAASIWGVQAGNGVIVISTRRGRFNQPLRFEFNSNITIGEKPDLFYVPLVSPSDFIDFETDLFGRGYYNGSLSDINKRAVSPVVEILNNRKLGLISGSDSAAQINALKGYDLRRDMLKYLYRNQVNQQYQFNLSGGNHKMNYYFSGGYDRRLSGVIANSDNRVTFTNQTTYLLSKNIQLRAGIAYTESNTISNGVTTLPNSFPYQRLVDDNGLELPIPQHRAVFEDTISNRGFPGWKYYPLLDRKSSDRKSHSYNTRLLAGLKYSILKGLSLDFSYQYNRTLTRQRGLKGERSYYVRDRINSFPILNNGFYTGSNFPKGGILDLDNSNMVSHYGRLNLQYNRTWSSHSIAAIAGAEVREIRTEGSGDQLYGYNDANGTFVTPNLFVQYPTYPSGILRNLDGLSSGVYSTGTLNRFRTYFSNVAYTFKDKYTLSTSFRFDGTNYFGVNTNQKTVPLWSVGVKWDIVKENFYKIKALPILGFRITYGYQGNLDQNRSAFATIKFFNTLGFTGLPYAFLTSIPNPELRWEKTGQLNLAVDFATRNNRLSGSLQYFIKNGKDLIGEERMDPTTGVTLYYGNFSAMQTKGTDIVLTIRNVQKAFQWSSTFNFNYAADKITRYTGPQIGHISAYEGPPVPIVGKPLYPVFSYRWAGLDPVDGAPRIYVSDTINRRYSGTVKVSDLLYGGRYNPPINGSVLTQLQWKGISFSFNIMYKLGHYFRRNSISYSSYIGSGWEKSHTDYLLRWQKPGDETLTDVPSISYSGNQSRDHYYNYSNILLERGDHIRLQFLNLSYSLPQKLIKRYSFQSFQFYFYANNLGILWRANDKGIDPDSPYLNYPTPRTYSFGIKAGL